MVDYDTSSGLRRGKSGEIGNVSMLGGRSITGESRQLKRGIGQVTRAALTAALMSSTALIASSAAVNAQAVWEGMISSDFTDNANWLGGIGPLPAQSITIPGVDTGNGAYNPNFTGGAPLFGNLTVKGTNGFNAALELSSGTMSFADVKLQEDITSGSGLLILKSSSVLNASSLSLESGALSELRIDKSTANITGLTTVTAGAINILTGGSLTTGGGLNVNGGIVSAAGGTATVDGVTNLTAGNIYIGSGAASVDFSAKGGLQISDTGSLSLTGSGSKLTVGAAGVGGDLKIEGAASSFIVDTGAAADVTKGVHVAGNLIANDAGKSQIKSGYLDVTGNAAISGRKFEVGASANAAAMSVGGALQVSGVAGEVVVGGVDDFMTANGTLTVVGLTTIGGVGANGPDAKLTVLGTGKLAAQGDLTINDHAQLIINGGKAEIGAGNKGTVTVLGSGKVTLSSGSLEAGSLVLQDEASTLVVDTGSSPSTVFSISGKGSVEAKSGWVTLASGNTFTGGVTLSNTGTLMLSDITQLGAGDISGKRAVRFDGGVLRISSSDITDDSNLEFKQVGQDYKLEITPGNLLTINQVLSGSKGLTSGGGAGGGTLVLTGNNTYEGATTINNGAVRVSDINNLGAGLMGTRTVKFNDALATLEIDGTTLTGDRFLDGSALAFEWANGKQAGISILDSSNTFTLRQAVSNGALFEKKGGGTLVLAQDDQNISSFTGLKISEGTVAATTVNQISSAGGVTLSGGFLKVGDSKTSPGSGLADNSGFGVSISKASVLSQTINSGFDIAKYHTFTLLSDLISNDIAHVGTATLVKKGDGTLVLAGGGTSAQANNILQAGILRVSTLGQLGGIGAKVTFQRGNTFQGGILGIGDDKAPAALIDDTDITFVVNGSSGYEPAIGFDIGKGSTFNIINNALSTSGALGLLGEGTLILTNSGINYTGGTFVLGGTLKAALGAGPDDKSVFRFKNGVYGINGGTLESNLSDLTITQLMGTGTTGAEKLNGGLSFNPPQYELNAGRILLTYDSILPAERHSTTLTVNETNSQGFWGKIEGYYNQFGPEELAGTLNINASSNREVQLIGNASKVGAVTVQSGTLRVNNGILPISDAPGALTTTHYGSLKANTISVNGSSLSSRASLAGSGTVTGFISIGEFGSLLGQTGTLRLEGNVTLSEGATIELNGFKQHYNAPGSAFPANPYFHVEGSAVAIGDVKINLNDDAIDPGVYRIISSSNPILGSGYFKIGTTVLEPTGSNLTLTTTGQNIDMHAATGRAALRFWNATPDVDSATTWSVTSTDWTNYLKQNSGTLLPMGETSVLAVFGYTDFPQQSGTVNVQSQLVGSVMTDNALTHGVQFVSGDWNLKGDTIQLLGGATGTTYEGWSTFSVGAGNVKVENQLYGTAGLRKTGVGDLTLSGVNSYAGGTQVLGGKLIVNNDINLGQLNGGITLAGGHLALGSEFGSTSRAISVTSNEGAGTSTISLNGSKVNFNGALTGNGTLVLENGHAVFAGNAVNLGSGNLNVSQGASLTVNGAGYIRTANISGVLNGSFGHTLGIKELNLASSAEVKLVLPSASNGTVAAFSGSNAALNGQISALDLPAGYAVGDNGTSLYVFDYMNRTGQITISDAVKAQYADSNFTFGGVVNGYLVLNSKTNPNPNPPVNDTVNVDTVGSLQNWTESTFVDGMVWNNGTAQFNGTGTGKPINIEGLVRIAGLTVNGQNFLFQDAGVSGLPGAFLLQSPTGTIVPPALIVASGGSATIAVPLGGADFIKTGGGLLTLSGNSGEYQGLGTVDDGTLYVTGNFSGAGFAVNNGLLRVNGQAGAVTVNANGTLEGVYTGAANSRGVNIGALIVNGGTLKPGNSPGTLRVGGLSQTAGTIAFERGDFIQVLGGVGGTPDGKAVFSKANDGSRVQLQLSDSRGYTFGNTYTFVTAENGVIFNSADAVQVSEVNNRRLFSGFQAEASGTNGNFYLQRNRGFATEAWSRNQAAVALALESQDINGRRSVNPIYNAIASASNDEAFAVRAAFDQLSGEIHASAAGVLIDESRHLREATTNRTRAALSGVDTAPGQIVYAPKGANLALWGQAYGSWGETQSTQNTAKVDRSTGGFVLGFDTGIADNWRLGVAGGYAKSDIQSKSNYSKADVDNYNLAIYGGGQFGAFGLRMGAGYTWHRLDTSRQLNVLGLRDTATAKYDARTVQLYGEAGYELKFDAATVEPFLNLAYVHYENDSFNERDTGLGLALRSRSNSEGTGFSTLGLRVSKNFDLGGVKGVVRGTLGWRYAFGDINPQSVFTANNSSLFTITGAPIAENALVLGAGLDVEIAAGTTLGVSYNGQIGNHTSDHGVRGNFSIKF